MVVFISLLTLFMRSSSPKTFIGHRLSNSVSQPVSHDMNVTIAIVTLFLNACTRLFFPSLQSFSILRFNDHSGFFCPGYLKSGDCYIRQLHDTFLYDYEYLGPTVHPVLTPLTDRCILSMTQTLRSFHYSILVGCSGSGKSETVNYLATVVFE